MKEYTEKYLEAIYTLSLYSDGVGIGNLAKKLNVTKPSATFAVKELKNFDLVNQKRYGKIYLTEKGAEEAERIYNRHIMLTEFFCTALDIDKITAEKNVYKIEQSLCDDMLIAIKKYLKNSMNFIDTFS